MLCVVLKVPCLDTQAECFRYDDLMFYCERLMFTKVSCGDFMFCHEGHMVRGVRVIGLLRNSFFRTFGRCVATKVDCFATSVLCFSCCDVMFGNECFATQV